MIGIRNLPHNLWPWLVYTLLALAVLAPLLAPGYLFTMDMAFTPTLRMPDHMSSSYLLHAGLHYLNVVLPGDVLQKLLLGTILLTSGLGMHRLLQYIQQTKPSPQTFHAVAAYVAGTLYMINPFTYSRFMAGQYAVLLGYALLPIVLRSMLQFLAVPTLGRVLELSLWLTLLAIASIHSLGLAVVLIVTGMSVFGWRNRANRTIMGRYVALGLVGLGVFVVASGYWLFPLLAGDSNQSQAMAHFSANDRTAFATVGGSAVDKLANVLQLQGFWAEGQDMFLLPGDMLPGWILAVLGLWVLVGMGIGQLWRRQRAVCALLLGSSILAVGLAVFGTPEWPLLRGYREPQKFVGLLALAYAVFAGFGAAGLLDWASRKKSQILLGLCTVSILLLPVALTPTMYLGFAGQLKPRHYPADWYQINALLASDPSDSAVLFIPWHLYANFPFAGRVVVSPAEEFFDKPIINSNELEYNGAAPTFPDAQKDRIGQLLRQTPHPGDIADRLYQEGIGYILLAKILDYQAYDYLGQQPHIQLVRDTPNLTLYRITHD